MSVAAGSASASASLIARNLRSVRSRIVDAVSKSPFKQQVRSFLPCRFCIVLIYYTGSDTKCTLVAVSKTKPVEDLKAAYDEGQRHFGENYVR
jgi:hypothetical protein